MDNTYKYPAIPPCQLDEQKPTSKSISLSALTKLPIIECRFNTLKQEVDRIISDIS